MWWRKWTKYLTSSTDDETNDTNYESDDVNNS